MNIFPQKLQIEMKKYSIDHKSNQNTSCTSDRYSLMSSSMYSEGSLSQSISKINELKILFNDTCQQETTLQKQNQMLVCQLDDLKRKLEQMIDDNFTDSKNKSKKAPSFQNQSVRLQKKFKPGSIAKLKKNFNTATMETGRPLQQKIGDDLKFKKSFIKKNNEQIIYDENSIQQNQKKGIKSHKRRISNQRYEKQSGFEQESSKIFRNPNRQSIEEEKNRKNIKQSEIDENQYTKIRSYLSSPRASIRGSKNLNINVWPN